MQNKLFKISANIKRKLWTRVFTLSFVMLAVSSVANADNLSEKEYLNEPRLSAEMVVNQIQLSWTMNDEVDFKHYYVVKSQVNSSPSYPENDVVFSTSDREEVSYSEYIELQDNVDHYYRVCAVNTKNNVSCGNIIHVFPEGVISTYDFFQDVERDSWYEPFVRNLVKKDILYAGYNHYFYPEVAVTRSELARWVIRAMIERGDFDLSVKSAPFCDVGSSHPEALYINHAYRLGIVEGMPATENTTCANGLVFEPDRAVSRAEALKMILLAFDFSPDGGVVSDETERYANSDLFSDVHQSHWAAQFIGRAKDQNIISGYPDDTFKPNQTVNHAEMAKMLSIAFRFNEDE